MASRRIQTIAAAIKDELERQGVLYTFDAADRRDLTSLCMNTGESADLTALALAVDEALERSQKPSDRS